MPTVSSVALQCKNAVRATLGILLLTLSLLAPSLALTEDHFLPLIDTSTKEAPWKTAEWNSLLHYSPSLSGIKSTADTEEFFFAPSGKRNPQQEYLANRAQLSGKSYFCRFPARTRYIMHSESLDGFHEKIKVCTRLQEWLEALKSTAVSLVFPSSFLNNPASAFGHTLLRLHTQQSVDSPLISYAINFSAKTGNDGPLPYAVKGVFGGHSGFFDVAPYYERLRLYSESENRDIWEYTLNYTSQEIESLLLHLWELRSIGFSYFYFDDNCSAILLELLQSARPSADLRSEEKPWVFPLDTIMQMRSAELLNEEAAPIFRPSPLRSFRERLEALTKDERSALKEILNEQDVGALDTATPNTLDAAIDFIYYRMFAKYEQEKWRDLQFALLNERSKRGLSPAVVTTDTPSNPLDAHLSSRLSFAGGYQDNRAYTALGFRGAYHEILDFGIGHSDESEIEFVAADLRIFEDSEILLQSLDLLHIRSLPLYGEFISPLSWGLDLGYEQTVNENPVFGSVQAGIAKPLFNQGRGWLHIGGRNEVTSGEYAVGPIIEGGLMYPFSTTWRAKLLYTYAMLYGEEDFDDHRAELGINYALTTNTALRFANGYQERDGHHWNDSTLACLLYF